MKRAKLTEIFHGEGDRSSDSAEHATVKGNETLTIEVKGGRLTFLTDSSESDEDAIRAGRFVTGEMKLENGFTFSFWISDEGRGGLKEVATYPAGTPQTG